MLLRFSQLRARAEPISVGFLLRFPGTGLKTQPLGFMQLRDRLADVFGANKHRSEPAPDADRASAESAKKLPENSVARLATRRPRLRFTYPLHSASLPRAASRLILYLERVMQTDDGLRPVEILDGRIGTVAIALDNFVGGLHQPGSHVAVRAAWPENSRPGRRSALDTMEQVPIGVDGRNGGSRVVRSPAQRRAFAPEAIIISGRNANHEARQQAPAQRH